MIGERLIMREAGVLLAPPAPLTTSDLLAKGHVMAVEQSSTTSFIGESWFPVFAYEGYYSVSSMARVRRDAAGRGTRAGHILSQTILQGPGYLRVALVRDGHQVTRTVHSLVAEAFLGPRPDKMSVNHKDGNKLNNLPANLEYISLADNTRHQWRTGLVTAAMHAQKLTTEKVVLIRQDLANGDSKVVVARRFNVSRQTINDIATGRTWRPEQMDEIEREFAKEGNP